jgi:hypothetical protein
MIAACETGMSVAERTHTHVRAADTRYTGKDLTT